jgi:hypothetical protein
LQSKISKVNTGYKINLKSCNLIHLPAQLDLPLVTLAANLV